MQGRSIVPLLEKSGEKPDNWREALYYAYYGERTHQVARHDGIRTERHTLFYVPKYQEWQLFDNDKDPQQMKSVHGDPEYADVLSRLQKNYQELNLRI